VFAKKLLNRLIYGVIAIQTLLLLIDGFPIGLSALSIASHVIYAQNLRRFPIVKLTDPLFLLSCGTCPSQLPPATNHAAATSILTKHSSRNRKPLPLVPPLQRALDLAKLILQLPLRPPRYPLLHRNRLLLRPLCVACAVRAVRLAERGRERAAIHGLRVRHWRRQQLHFVWHGAERVC
jgi:hypothetical protein